MSQRLAQRLDQILPHITTESFLSTQGIGNEIACYIFDYPAQHELQFRAHLQWMLQRFESHHPTLKVLHLHMLEETLAMLQKRNLLEKSLEMNRQKGDAAVVRAIRGPIKSEQLRDFIAQRYDLPQHDLILLSGVGSVWPVLRAHGLLNSLHSVIDHTPLVLFYPGNFDGTSLKLFGQIRSDTQGLRTKHYYRAFRLIPEETAS